MTALWLLMHEGAPLLWGTTPGEIREAILSYPDDDADLFAVWKVPSFNRLGPATDCTIEFATGWAKICVYVPGHSPAEHVSRMPAFIRETIGDRLLAGLEPGFLPNVLRASA